MASIAGAPAPSLRRLPTSGHLLRRSLSSFLSLPSLLLFALLLSSFRLSIHSISLRLVLLTDSDPFIQSRLISNSLPIPVPSPSPPPKIGHFSPLPSLFPDPIFASSPRFSPVTNSSVNFTTSDSKSVEIPVPESFFAPFFFTAALPDGNRSGNRTVPTGKEIAVTIGLIYLGWFCYFLMVWIYVLLRAAAFGVVFYSVVSTEYFNRPLVPLQIVVNGSSIGVKRLNGLLFLHWIVNLAVLEFCALFYIVSVSTEGELDEIDIFKVLCSWWIIPFGPVSFVSPFSYSSAHSGFFLAYTLMGSLVSVVFTMPRWVELVEIDDKREDKCVFKEGIFLLSLMRTQALFVKVCEAVLTGSVASSLMVRFLGRFWGGVVYSVLEVYFMLVWFNFYVNVRCKEAELAGKRFELRDLESSLDDVKLKL